LNMGIATCWLPEIPRKVKPRNESFGTHDIKMS
jgi:hypothetical protein